jgi:hypothetical protein
MKHLSPTEKELAEILVWESSFLSLTEDQQSLCVALHRNTGPIPEEELATDLACTVGELRATKLGIHGILVDASTGNYWVK